MREKNLFIMVTMSWLLMLLLVVPVSAVTRARESNLRNGWQIWIEAADFDRRDPGRIIKTGAERPELVEKAPAWLAEDVIVAPSTGGFMEYDFESAEEGEAHIYCRCMDFRGGNQSWHIMLNTNQPNMGVDIDTGGNWIWNASRDNVTRSPTDLKKGRNTIRITAREAGGGQEILLDIIMISTEDIGEKLLAGFDDEYINETTPVVPEAVRPGEKLTATWGSLKGVGDY